MPTLAGPTAAITFAAPAGTVSAGVTLSAPVATFRITAPPGSVNGELVPDSIDAYLYDYSGKIQTAYLSNADQLLFRPEVSQRGNANLHVPLDDAGLIGFGGIVKFVWRGQVRFGCRIASEATKLGTDDRKWVVFDNQPGLLSLLDQAFIEPEYGLKRTSSGDRHFGYPSADGPWRIASNWHAPRSVPWGQPGGRHFALPTGFTTADNWIARSSPNTGVSSSTQNWFICDFTLADTIDCSILAAGDNFLEMYMDGELIHPVDRTDYFAWRSATPIPIRLTAGAHRWAARVENTVPVPAFAGSPNPVGFIANLRRVDKDGTPVAGAPIIRTNTTDWIVTDITPGWRKAQVLKKLIEEAQARGVPGAVALRIGFTDTHDSAGQPWTDAPGEYTFSIGTMSLADVAATLGEGINIIVDADTMTVLAYADMGADKSATVEWVTGEGGGVIAYDVTAASSRSTVVLMRLEDGTWQEVPDTAGIAAVGRIETGLSLGTASTPATATGLAQAQLAESAHPLIGITCQVHPSQGPQIFDAFDLGDTIRVGVGVLPTWFYSPDWGWMADCGLYTGPWPPVAPPTLPAGAFELDFYVGVPMPDVTFPPLGSHYDVWRTAAGPDVDDGGLVSLPPGAHLYLGWWNDAGNTETPAPTVDPLALVPAGYIAADRLPLPASMDGTPGSRGAALKARCLAVTVKKVDGAVQVFPEFVEDRT